MNYKKSKFSLIFRIISLILIQSFLLLDIVWAAGGELSVANEGAESSTLAPKITFNSKEVLDTYLYFLENSAKISEVTQAAVPSIPNESKQSAAIGRRTFLKEIIGVATVLTGVNFAIPSQPQARDLTVDMRDLVVSFNQDVTEAELNKYVAIIESQGFKGFSTVEKTETQTLIRIQGLFPLNAEKLSHALNAQAKVRGLLRDFVITSSDSSWEKSLTYSSMQTFANKVADISSGLGFGEIDSSELVGLYEGITWVESKFHQWEKDLLGKIIPVRSYTNAIGVTQVIESQAVTHIAEWILTHKGGLSRYAEIMNELERMISSEDEKVKEALKLNRKFVEETAQQKKFNVYDDFTAYNNADLDIGKEKQIIRKIHRKINENTKLIGVNFYYALAVWEYLRKRKNFQAVVTADIAKSMGQTARGLTRTRNKKQVKLIESGPGAYKPDNLEKAGLQFQRDYFRLNVLYEMIGPEKIIEILRADTDKRFDRLMSYLIQQMMTKTGNQKLGYSYLTINWDRYRRFELVKTEKNKYEFMERPLSYFKNNSNGFSVGLAAAASYNAGTGTVDRALLNFGATVEVNNIPLWIKHMIGANSRNIREPINYLRAFLEDKFNNTGKLSQEDQNIKNDLIAERYKRVYKVEDRLLENRELVRKNGVRMYSDYNRSDSFDHKLAFLLARVAGSDYVDSFLRSHGIGKKWEAEIFSRTTPTFDILAFVLSNENAPGYDDALSLQQYLDKKHFTASLAYLDERIEYFKQQEQISFARIELAKQIEKEKEWQKTMAFMKTWVMRSAIGAASLAAAGVVAWIMRRRVKLGKKAVPPFMYRLQALGILGLFIVRAVVAIVRLFVSAGSYMFSFFGRKKTARSSLLGDQKPVRKNRFKKPENKFKKNSGNKFISIILISLLFVGIGIINPQDSPALTAVSITSTQTGVHYSAEVIPNTNVYFAEVRNTNDALGYWAVSGLKKADFVLVGNPGASAAMTEELLKWWVDLLSTDQPNDVKNKAIHDAAVAMRPGSALFAAGIGGIMDRSFVISLNEQEEDIPKKDLAENWAVTVNGFYSGYREHFELNEEKFAQYSASVNNLYSIGGDVRLKDGFVLHIDIKEFVNKGIYRRSRDDVQKDLDLLSVQLFKLARAGKRPSLITMAKETAGYISYDTDWTVKKLKDIFESLYSQSSTLVSGNIQNISGKPLSAKISLEKVRILKKLIESLPGQEARNSKGTEIYLSKGIIRIKEKISVDPISSDWNNISIDVNNGEITSLNGQPFVLSKFLNDNADLRGLKYLELLLKEQGVLPEYGVLVEMAYRLWKAWEAEAMNSFKKEGGFKANKQENSFLPTMILPSEEISVVLPQGKYLVLMPGEAKRYIWTANMERCIAIVLRDKNSGITGMVHFSANAHVKNPVEKMIEIMENKGVEKNTAFDVWVIGGIIGDTTNGISANLAFRLEKLINEKGFMVRVKDVLSTDLLPGKFRQIIFDVQEGRMYNLIGETEVIAGRYFKAFYPKASLQQEIGYLGKVSKLNNMNYGVKTIEQAI